MTTVEDVDLSRYQTDELAARVADILAIPEAVWTVFSTTLLAAAALLVGTITILSMVDTSWIPLLLASLYALVIGVAAGFLLGLTRVANATLSHATELMQLTLETCQTVAGDYQRVRSGDKRIPPAGEIVAHVYDSIIMPVIESTVANSLGILGKPLLWTYRRTIGGVVRYMIAQIETESLTEEQESEIETNAEHAMREVSENASSIERTLGHFMGYTSSATKMLRKFVVRPIQILLAIAVISAMVPPAALWYLSK